jgi:hypothetical protein
LAYADSFDPPTSYSIEFDDGNKIFYMTVHGEESESQLATGLYHKDGTNIYLVHTNRFFNHLTFSEDGLLFVATLRASYELSGNSNL